MQTHKHPSNVIVAGECVNVKGISEHSVEVTNVSIVYVVYP